MKKNVTTKEIARIAQVSVGTVDRVIHKRPGVSKKTKDKVERILKEVSYRPNLNARKLVLNKVFKIVALLPRFNKNDYWELPVKGTIEGAEEFSPHGLELLIKHYSQDDVSSFNEQVKNLFNMQIDAVILAPIFKKESLELSEDLKKRAIPLILIDANLPGSNALSSIGQDAFKSGFLAAKLMALISSKTYSFIINFSDTAKNNIILKRIEGYQSYFEEKGLDQPIVKTFDVHLLDLLEEFILSQLKSNGFLNVFLPHSKSYLISEIKRKNNIKDELKIIGYDLLVKNKEGLKNNLIHFIIHQKPEHQGFRAVECLYKNLILGESITTNHSVPIDIITKENLEFAD